VIRILKLISIVVIIFIVICLYILITINSPCSKQEEEKEYNELMEIAKKNKEIVNKENDIK